MFKKPLAFLCFSVPLLSAQISLAMSCHELLASGNKAFALSRDALREEGDFIHSIWQTGNSYRTRYKAMKLNDENPVTDIAKYIADRNIPAEYRGYYRRTTKGTYEEDIKKIPNQWLAHNNSKENAEGARSYLENLHRMSGQEPHSQSQAVNFILDSLRAIHVEWYNRNASWTVPYGEPKTFDEANIEAQYNGALQYYKIAERHGLFKNHLWRAGFDEVMKGLIERKFTPYKEMNVVDAYLSMTHKTGAKPAITGDTHVEQFFDHRFHNYSFAMPSDRTGESAAVLSFLSNEFPTLYGVPASRFEIKAPPVPPGSDARIYLIKDKSPNGVGLVAVMKIQANSSGLDEIVSTMAAEKGIISNEDFRPVKTLAYGKLGASDYFMIQEAAKTFEADHAFKGEINDRYQMVIKVSKALATMHGRASEYSGDELKSISADLTTFRGNCFYDVRQMGAFFKNGRNDIISPAEKEGSLSVAESRELEGYLENLREEYSRIVELEPETLSPTVIHGDFHGGNLFLTNQSNKSRLIDFGGSTWFIGKKIGTGDRGNDVGRMIGNVLVESTRYGLDFESEILPLIRELMSSYKQQIGIVAGSPQELNLNTSVFFYMNRFLAVNANDTAGKKFKPISGDTLSELRHRLYQNWLLALRSLKRDMRASLVNKYFSRVA